jgi:hypothetical protein
MHSVQLRKTLLLSAIRLREFFLILGSEVFSESFQSIFLQPNYVHIKPELPLSFTVAVVTIFQPFVQTFSKQSSPELRNVVRHFSADILETQQH